MIRCLVEFCNRHVFVRRMRDVDRPGPEQQWLAPRGEEWNIGRVRKHRRLVTGGGLQANRRHFQHVIDSHEALEGRYRSADVRGVADRPKHHLRLGGRRDDIRRNAAADHADGVVRASENGIVRQCDRSQLDQRVDQFVDRRLAELGKRRMCRPARRREPQAQDAACCASEAAVGRLAVHEKPAVARRGGVRRARAVAAALFADDEDQANARFPVTLQPIGRRNHRREDPFRVA
jgi:hypothetical protein